MEALALGGFVHETSGDRREDGMRLWAAAGQAYQIAFRATGSREAAEDAVQQAFLVALRELPAGLPASEERLWFFRVVTNAAGNLRRSELRRKGREALVMQERETEGSPAGAGSDLVGALRRAMGRLDAKYRLPVALCYEQGLTRNEAAGVLRMPARTVSKYVNVGLEKLRKALARAGYPAAAAAVLGGLKETAPQVPASLAGRVEALVSSGARVEPRKLASRVACKRSAAKGGIAMKILAGVVLTGAVAAGVAMVGGGLGPLGTAGPVERKDPAPDQAYRIEPVPAGTTSMGYGVDDAARLFWVNSAVPTVCRYEPGTRRTTTIAGTAFGVMDGPLDRARFGGWSYNQPSGMQVSGDGQSVFVKERNGLWRLIDLEAGVARTLFPYTEKGGAHNVVAKDKSGEMYVFKTSGEEPPDAPGCRKLKVARFQCGKHGCWIGYMDGYALDVERMRFYWHARGDVMYCDLKTGVLTNLNPGPKRGRSTTGDVKSWKPYCPAGLSISPSGRYLYVGGGDDNTTWRFDLEKDRCDALGWNAATGALAFGEIGKGWKCVPANLTFWPNVTVFAPDGSGYWATQGCMRLVPVK